MESIQNLVEYYDELYPITDAQQKFYDSLIDNFPHPTKFLNIGCGTGVLEHRLAKDFADVTGLETFKELLDSATRKYRTQLMSVRYFQMSTIEMSRFLGKKFYNVISCLNDRIIFINNQVLMKKFFFDCKQLLAEEGVLILSILNYDFFIPNPSVDLPPLTSMRAEMVGKITINNGEAFLDRKIKTGNGKLLPVFEKTPVYLLQKDEIVSFAKEAGFKTIDFFSDWNNTRTDESTKNLIVVIK